MRLELIAHEDIAIGVLIGVLCARIFDMSSVEDDCVDSIGSE